MKLFFQNKKIVLICRLVLGIIFIYASISKIANPVEFSNSIDNYHIIPSQLSNLAALIIPWIEFFIGLCFIVGVFLDGASLISIVLLAWFIFILSQALARGIDLHCGCFDLAEKQINDFSLRSDMFVRIAQDLLFLVMSFIVKYRNR